MQWRKTWRKFEIFWYSYFMNKTYRVYFISGNYATLAVQSVMLDRYLRSPDLQRGKSREPTTEILRDEPKGMMPVGCAL